MKIGVVGDIHWSRYSSILRNRGDKYSFRLENCIKSINWAENLTRGCDTVVYLGDFFDSSELNSEEITALHDIVWNNNGHIFLVGNHEMGINDLSFSSSHLFKLLSNDDVDYSVIDSPFEYYYDGVTLSFLPYVLEDDRKPLSEYFPDKVAKRIIFSHNDLAGIQMGKFMSKNGFTLEEIHENCDLFLNGHLHNGSKVEDGIINVGNLTGQNFSEDAFVYDHTALILDTDTMKCAVYENPYAINFYKIDATASTFDVSTLKQNSVITIKTYADYQNDYKKDIDNCNNIVASRIILQPSEHQETTSNSKELLAVNHLDKFSEYILRTLGNSDMVTGELEEVLS